MLFEKEALKDINDFEGMKKLFPKRIHKYFDDLKSIADFRQGHGTYMPGENEEMKDKLMDLRIKGLIDQLDKIYQEQKKFVDIWFPTFKKIYENNKKFIKLGSIHYNQYHDNLTLESFYENIISFKTSKIINPNMKKEFKEIPTIRLLVNREKDLLVEYIKLDNSFSYSYITYKTIKKFLFFSKSYEFPIIATKDEDDQKAFLPYLNKQLCYFAQQEFKLKPNIKLSEARWIKEGELPEVL